MKDKHKKYLLAASTAMAAYLPVHAQAQAAGEDIIVTARRVEERLQDVPISITVFNQEQITNRNLVNATDLATYTPALTSNANFGSENSTYAIRGFVQDIATAPTVGVYFADVVAPRGPTGTTQAGDGAGPGSFFDLQNVQVLKGPQGTLFGRNTTGGAVLFVPQKPTSDLEGYLEGTYGNYDARRLQGAINLPLGDSARMRIAADHMKRDGWMKNTSGIGPRDFGDVDYIALRASLVVDLTPDLENYTIASYMQSDTNGSVQKLAACSPAIGVGASLACPQLARNEAEGAGFFDVQSVLPNARSKLTQWQLINTTTWRLTDNLTLKNIVSYAQLQNTNRTVLFGSDFRLGIAPLGIPEQRIIFNALVPAPNTKTADAETITEELQIQGSFGDRLTYQAGAYMEVTNPLGPAGNQVPTLLACSNISSQPPQCLDVLGIGASAQTGFTRPIQVGGAGVSSSMVSYRDYGLSTQATYKLNDVFKVTGGLRYTWDRSRATTLRTTTVYPVLPPFTGATLTRCSDPLTAPSCTETLNQRSDAPTWLINLDYTPTRDLLVYAKYARGYRTGGVAVTAPVGFRTFEPEKLDAYEAGLKASFSGAVSGFFNVAGFYNKFSDQQLRAGFSPAPGAVVPNTTGVLNVGRSRIYGADIDASITPFTGFTVDGSYAYLNTKLQNVAPIVVTDPNYIASQQIAAGSRLTYSPKHKFSVTGRYTLPLGDEVGQVTLGATYSYSASYLTSYAYQEPGLLAAYGGVDYGRIPSFGLLNLNLNWTDVAGLPIDLAAFGTNVTNKKYVTNSPGIGLSGAEYVNLGEPRMYGLRLRYRFGS